MEKKYMYGIIIPIMLLFELEVYSQTSFSFQYDLSGNRTYRNIVTLLKSGTIEPTEAVQVDSANYKPHEFKDEIGNTQIKIYPNPVKELLQVEIPLTSETPVTLQVYTSTGGLLRDVKVTCESTKIDLNGQPAGIYILKISIGEKTSEWKIIKD
jgi:hypothetical protein